MKNKRSTREARKFQSTGSIVTLLTGVRNSTAVVTSEPMPSRNTLTAPTEAVVESETGTNVRLNVSISARDVVSVVGAGVAVDVDGVDLVDDADGTAEEVAVGTPETAIEDDTLGAGLDD
jgi:hypothetical protein